jgi:YegS/Rv2252/BmrU family lipid kinase
MPEPSEVRPSRFFVIVNSAAGSYQEDVVRNALARHFSAAERFYELHETTGQDNLAALARAAIERGCDAIVAAGGDGTVSAVTDAVIGTSAILGIIPLGTTNVLARELKIPLEMDAACSLLAGAHEINSLDAMEANGSYYVTQIGIGIDALMIRDTARETKRRFGRLAYVWSACVRLLGFQPRRFQLVVDGRKTGVRASQVLVANCGTLGQPPFRWGPNIHPDDGRVDVCVLRARNTLDYLSLAWHVVWGLHTRSPNARYLNARKTVSIAARKPLPVQADGEIIGETPIEIRVIPRAVRVIAPQSVMSTER